MLEQVEQKIQELKKIQAEEFYKKKDADLSTWGLTSKKNGKKITPIPNNSGRVQSTRGTTQFPTL